MQANQLQDSLDKHKAESEKQIKDLKAKMASLQKQLDEATKYIKEKHTQIKKLVTENETTTTK